MFRVSAVDRPMMGTILRKAAWKWLHRSRIEAVYRRVYSSVDHGKFDELRRRYRTTTQDTGPNKYVDLEHWLRESVVRALRLKLDHPRRLRVIDLGSGTGYFLHACRVLGHDASGIDLDGEPIFNDVIELLSIPRRVHVVTPDNPLPAGNDRYDLITAFMITFNGVESDHEWGADEWAAFTENCLERLTSSGRLFLSFNYSLRRRQFYDRQTAALFDSLSGCRTRRRGNEVLIARQGER